MQRFPLTSADRALIRQALDCLRANRDEIRWNHTVGCALRMGG